MELKIEIRAGICACGCGHKTTQLKNDDKARGLKKGDYSKFIQGHWHNVKRGENAQWGNQYRRIKQRDAARRELAKVAIENPRMSVETLHQQVAKEFRLEGVSRLLNFARQCQFYGIIPSLNTRKNIQRVDQYERKEIDYEKETELPMLTWQRFILSLDEDVEETNSRHETIPGRFLSPLELLIEKEENVEREREAMISKYAARIATGKYTMWDALETPKDKVTENDTEQPEPFISPNP